MFAPNVSCSCVCLYRLLRTTFATASRLRTMTSRWPVRWLVWSRTSAMPWTRPSLTSSAILSARLSGLTWYGSSVTTRHWRALGPPPPPPARPVMGPPPPSRGRRPPPARGSPRGRGGVGARGPEWAGAWGGGRRHRPGGREPRGGVVERRAAGGGVVAHGVAGAARALEVAAVGPVPAVV